MFTNLKNAAAVLTVAATVLAASQADAGWRHHG